MADYYVDGAVGDNGNAGTSEGSGNAWATIVYAATQVAAGDNVYIKSSATYSGTVVLSTAGGAETAISWIGYDSVITDGGMVTMDNGGTNGYGWSGANIHYQHFRNITVTDYGSYDFWYMPNADYNIWINCVAHNGTGHGIYADNYNTLIGCQIYNFWGTNSNGIKLDNEIRVINTLIYHVRKYGVFIQGSGGVVINCVVYDTYTFGIFSRYDATIMNCTVDKGGEGIGIVAGRNAGCRSTVIMNNIVYDCATGIDHTDADNVHLAYGMNNLLYSNTADYGTNWPAHARVNDVTGVDPLFVDESARDYRLAEGSPARNAGADHSGSSSPGMDIGAHQSADAGGRTIITG